MIPYIIDPFPGLSNFQQKFRQGVLQKGSVLVAVGIVAGFCQQALANSGNFYTQIKIDEITNLGAVKIRLRSLIGALDERSSENGRA